MLFASAGVCFAMYAVWAMAECTLREETWAAMTRWQRFAWRLTSALSAIVGVFAAFALMLAAIGPLLGRWIS